MEAKLKIEGDPVSAKTAGGNFASGLDQRFAVFRGEQPRQAFGAALHRVCPTQHHGLPQMRVLCPTRTDECS